MRNTVTNILLVLVSAAACLGAVAVYNYNVDPMCYYRCDTVDLNRTTQNVYYRALQTAKANPDAEVLILGSSRGERISPKWVEEETGLKTVNLSTGGSDLFLKLALLNVALENSPKVKKVIWMADYFELVPTATDYKVYLTPTIWKLSGMATTDLHRGRFFERLQALIDHRTLEAGLEMTKKGFDEVYRKTGNGEEVDYKKCQADDFVGSTPPELMPKKIAEEFGIFGLWLGKDQSEIYWKMFEQEIQRLSDKGIGVVINLAPYHSQLMDRAEKEMPEVTVNEVSTGDMFPVKREYPVSNGTERLLV